MAAKDVVITKEYLERIRKYAAIRPDETFVYTPTAYRELPEKLRAKFTLKPVSGEKVLRCSDEMSGDVSMVDGAANIKVRRGAFAIEVVKTGLYKWENYYDINGRIVEYDASIDNLPRALIEELSDAILERSYLTEDEVLGLK